MWYWGAGGRRGDKLRGEGLCLSSGSVTEGHRPRGTHDGHRFSRLGVPTWWGSTEDPLPGLQTAAVSLHQVLGRGLWCLPLRILHEPPHTSQGPHTHTIPLGLRCRTLGGHRHAVHGSQSWPLHAGWQEVGSRRTGPGGQVGRGARMGRPRGRASDVAAAGVSEEGNEQGKHRR